MTALIVGNCDRDQHPFPVPVEDLLYLSAEEEEFHDLDDDMSNSDETTADGNPLLSHNSSLMNTEKEDEMIVSQIDDEKLDNDEGEETKMFASSNIAVIEALTRLFSAENYPGGLGPSVQYAGPAGFTDSSISSEENLSAQENNRLQNLQQLKVKFLRLAYRLGYTAESSLAAQVMYKLTVFAGRSRNSAFSFDNAKQKALLLEEEEKDDELNFSVNILVLGKPGVGKSATINSLFGEEKSKISTLTPGTNAVEEFCGILDGVKIRVIDVPGLKSSAMEQGLNCKILAKVKKFVKKYPPDVILYVDRLDSQAGHLNDIPMLKSITASLGSSIWQTAILTLTHACSAPPDGSLGTPLSYDTYVSRSSRNIQKSIGTAIGDYRLMTLNTLMPVSLVENHPSCRQNREGEKVLPNGEPWRKQLLLRCYAMKVLSEANSTSKSRDPFDQRTLFSLVDRSPPLSYFVTSLLQTGAHPELPSKQMDISDFELDLSDSDCDEEEYEYEYDQLPPFRPLKKSRIAKLSKAQKKAYFEEYDYRVKLYQKKQRREMCRILRELKKRRDRGLDDHGDMSDDENEASSTTPVTYPDRVLPLSFDSDNPSFRYRFSVEPTPLFLSGPFEEVNGFDHDCGYDGVIVQSKMGIAGCFPAEFMVQVRKDKEDFKIQMNSAVSAKYGETVSNLLGLDVRTIGDKIAYFIRGETKFKLFKRNKTAAGLCVIFLDRDVAPGVKIEHQINMGKRLTLTSKAGTVCNKQNAAYMANLEVRLRGKDYPIEEIEHLISMSLLKWRGDMGIEANIQPQFLIGRSSRMNVSAGLNNKLRGHITFRTSSSNAVLTVLGTVYTIAVASLLNFKTFLRI